MNKFDKRDIAKIAVRIVTSTAIGTAVTKSMVANVPATEKLKTAEMSGALAGYVLGEALQPYTDAAVDRWFDARAAKRK